MNFNVHDLAPSKGVLCELFTMEVDRIIGNVRRESQDEKDKLILSLQTKIKELEEQNTRLKQRINTVKESVQSL